jgi:hypothetical protein
VRFKFNPDKLKAEELEKIMKSKETTLNSKIVSNYLMRQAKYKSPVTPNLRNFAQPPKDDDDDDDDEDEEPLSRRIQPTRPKPASPAVTNTAEEPTKECPNLEEEDPDAEFVDSDSWSIDTQSNQFIMRFQNFNQQIDQIYLLSIQKFFNLIHADADPLP